MSFVFSRVLILLMAAHLPVFSSSDISVQWGHIVVPTALARPHLAPGYAVKDKARGPQGCPSFRHQRVGDDAVIAHIKPDMAAGSVELGTGVVSPIRAAAQDLKGQPVIQIPGNGPATDSDAAQAVPIIAGHGKFTAHGRDTVPVIPAYIVPRRPQVAGLDVQRQFTHLLYP